MPCPADFTCRLILPVVTVIATLTALVIIAYWTYRTDHPSEETRALFAEIRMAMASCRLDEAHVLTCPQGIVTYRRIVPGQEDFSRQWQEAFSGSKKQKRQLEEAFKEFTTLSEQAIDKKLSEILAIHQNANLEPHAKALMIKLIDSQRVPPPESPRTYGIPV
jgi:hypothetical protein